MSFDIADYTGITDYWEPAQPTGANGAKGANGVKAQSSPFADVFLRHWTEKKVTVFDEFRAINADRRAFLNHLLEKMRAESEAKRMELLAKLMQKDDDENMYDIWAKCLDIARRIMRGEKVSAEEMRLLAQHFPELLFQALLLKQEDKEPDESESKEKDSSFCDCRSF